MTLINADADPTDPASPGQRPQFFVLDDIVSGQNPEIGDEASVMGIEMNSLQQFGLDCALWAAGDIDGDGFDEIWPPFAQGHH